MPQIGEISPGLWLASAFGGQGINTTAMAGVLIARGIAERDQTWRLFAPYELVWAGGAFMRAVLQFSYWGSRASDGIRARLPKRRRPNTGSREDMRNPLPARAEEV
jgi:hypothetical protein